MTMNRIHPAAVAVTVSEAGTFAVGILCNAPTGNTGVYNCTFVDNDVTCEDDGVSTPVLSQGVIFSEAEATTAGARMTVVNCSFMRSAEDSDIRDVVQIGLHTADFHVINCVFTRGNRAQYNPFYASFPTKFHVRRCSVGGLTVKPDWLDIDDGWQTDAVPLGRVTDAATGRISYRPLCKMPSLRDCAEVVTNSLTANVVEPDRAPYYFTFKMRLSSESSWVSLLGDTLSAAYEGGDFADAFGAARPSAAATRGAVQSLPADAETGRTLLVRSDPYGAGVYTPDYWQVVQPGNAMTPVSVASANPAVATFSHWEDASGTTLTGAALDLGVITDDITIAKGVFTVPQVTIVLDLGVYGVFTADGTTRKELTLPVGSAFPLYTVGNAADYMFVGWEPALPEWVPAENTVYRGKGVTKDLRIIYLAPADDPVAANGAGDGTSWANAYRGDFIAAYQDAGTWRGEVWIKSGVYDASRTLDLLPNVHVRGGFAGTETVASQADPVANPVIYTGDTNHDNRYNAGDASNGTDTGVTVIDYENLAYNLPAPASRLTYWSATRNVSDGVSVAFTATTSVTNSVVEGLIVTGFKDKAANVSPIAHVGWRKCVFIGNNTAVNAGQAGAAFANYGACEFEDCDFIAMHTPLAILDNDSTQTDSNRLVRCRFLFNHGNASGTGGGFNVSNAHRDIILDDCEFADTYVWEYQGYQRCPVQIDTCKSFVMRDCRILRNTSRNRCVAAFDIEAVGEKLTIERCVFRDNQKYGQGTDSGKTAAALRLAALKWGSGYRHVVRDTLFEGNSVVHQEYRNGNNPAQVVRQASALSHSQGLLEVVNCTFVSNYVDTANAAEGSFGATVHAGRNGSQGYAVFVNCLFKDNEVTGFTTCDVMCHSSVTNTPVLFVNTIFASKATGYMPLLLHSNGYVAFRALNCAIQGYAPGAYPSATWGWDIGNSAEEVSFARRIERGPNGAYAIRAKSGWAAQAGRKIYHGTDGFHYVSMPEVNDAKPYFRLSNSTTYSSWWQTAVAGMTAENEAAARNRDAFGNPPRNSKGIPSLGPVNYSAAATVLTLR